MDNYKQAALASIDQISDLIFEMSDAIWDAAELGFHETKSAQLQLELLEKLGFEDIRTALSDIPTAFSARWGCGKPVIGFLGEYDALPELSQKANCTVREPIAQGGNGHGCGHNLLGAGSIAAACAVKEYLKATGRSGTVIYYGCPAEENGAAKAFMAREELWRGIDAALSWHPDDANEVVTGSTNACIQVQYKFHGVASHAAGAPEKGRSALDAVELMNIGVQFLREHMSDKARVHYAITDGGGRSPNVVQPTASVLYMVRSDKVAEAVSLQDRVDKIAEGAALMTETTFERQFIDGLAETIPNHVLENLLQKNFAALGVPAHTEEELAYAAALAATYPGSDAAPGSGSAFDLRYAAAAAEMKKKNGTAMNDFLLPLFGGESFNPGSTDIGDVSWQNVSCACTSLGFKAAVHAGKILACTVIDLLTDGESLAEARKEFALATAAGYTCPIPPEAVPVVPD